MIAMEIDTELSKGLIIELLIIIGDEGIGNSKSTYDRFPEELFSFSLCNIC